MYDLEPWKAPRRPSGGGPPAPPPPPGSPPDADNLRYRRCARVDLGENECTISMWGESLTLVFRFRRTTDNQCETRSIPIRVGARGPADGWELKRTDVPGRWQLAPSIQCWDHDDKGERVEVWHHTPAITDVPEGEPWQCTT